MVVECYNNFYSFVVEKDLPACLVFSCRTKKCTVIRFLESSFVVKLEV